MAGVAGPGCLRVPAGCIARSCCVTQNESANDTHLELSWFQIRPELQTVGQSKSELGFGPLNYTFCPGVACCWRCAAFHPPNLSTAGRVAGSEKTPPVPARLDRLHVSCCHVNSGFQLH